MANASVEKLKALGLRHGEKVLVCLAVAACIACLAKAVTQPTIQITPEEVEQHASAAASNLNKKQSTEDILKRLEDAGIKNPNFEKMVDDKEKEPLVATAFAPVHPYEYPQPGAGLIRDMPKLIAPSELIAYPGRGGALVYELDENGQKIVDTEAQAAGTTTGSVAPPPSPYGAPTRRRGGGLAEAKKAEEEAKKELEREAAKKRRLVAGKAAEKSKEEMAAEPAVAEGPFKETTKGLRWVAITGVLDYKTLRENYFNALKVPAYPHIKQLDVERQTRQTDGSWTEWEATDSERNHSILDNLPEIEEEYATADTLLDALVDPLPFLKAGFWEQVHVARLVPQEKIEVAPTPGAAGGGPGMPGYNPSYNPNAGRMPDQMRPGMIGGGPTMPGYGSGMEMAAGTPEDSTFPHTEAETVMIRSLDFTVEPDKTYRFRARIVVFNPNREREDVSPGVDTKSVELTGPWSEPTNDVTMPADVTAYTLAKGIPANRRTDQVQFDVTRWDPQSGITVERRFEAWPGEIVGDYYRSTSIPSSEGTGKKSGPIDFNTHELVLDTNGGELPLPQIAGVTGRFSVPAHALLVRPDGAVLLRHQAFDIHDEVRKDIVNNYKRELEESDQKRESSMGGRMMSTPYPGSVGSGRR